MGQDVRIRTQSRPPRFGSLRLSPAGVAPPPLRSVGDVTPDMSFRYEQFAMKLNDRSMAVVLKFAELESGLCGMIFCLYNCGNNEFRDRAR